MPEDKLLKAVARFVGIGADAARDLIAGYREDRPGLSGRDLYNVISSDHMYRRNAIEAAELKTQQGGAPAWLYEFTWKTPAVGGMLKTPHTLCLPFVFGNTEIAKEFTGTGPEQDALTKAVMGAWIAFARTGNPNHTGLPDWTPYDTAKRPTMIFDAECRLAHDPKPEDRVRINTCPRFVSDMQFPMPG
jgi:para-nitrobenzyl esterase